ncbi:MAG: glycine--tRNA ligase subunit beta, partial [Pseudomonadota bacterium]
EIADIDAYEKALADGRVILRAEDRKARIRDGARTLCAEAGLELFEDEGLLSEVAGLAEWPTPHLGRFDEKFLALPDEVITAAMRGHQKYFSVRAPKTGRLAPHFIAVADIEAGEGMLAGYERVLTARLSDALFLYNNDRQVSLEKHGEKLAGVTFFEGLGTLDDKVKRVAILARELAPLCGADPDDADRAARLAKADLSTEMVYEFPELQGLMGRYYALDQDVPVDIADAIRDHYKPQGQGDDLPTNALGVTVSLADKLDTLTAFWSIDQKPTGSRDPFALRRAALAVIRLILENTLRLELMATLAKAFAAQSQTSDVSQDLLAFFHDRLTVYFRDQGFRHDQVAAALTKGADDFVLVAQRLKALSEFLGTDEGTNLSAAYKRARNILKVEEKKGALPSFGVNPDHLQEAEEKDLHASLLQAEAGTRTRLGDEDFGGAMLELSKIRSGLDRFFNAVTVNADNAALRDNRLALLLRFVDVVQLVADFDRLEG